MTGPLDGAVSRPKPVYLLLSVLAMELACGVDNVDGILDDAMADEKLV